MKVVLAFAFCALVAVVYGNVCTNGDPSLCTHTCPDGESKACEHDVCTCAKKCSLKEDCSACPQGHIGPEEVHCVDGACVCMPGHMQPPGGHHGGLPG